MKYSYLILLGFLFSGPLLAQGAPTPVIVAAAEKTEVIEEVPLTGTVVSIRQARLSSEIDGMVDDIGVQVGDRVATGDVILRLKADIEQLSLRAKRAEVEQTRRELADAERRLIDAERLGRSNTVSANEISSLRAEVSIDSAEVSRLEAEEQRQQLRLRQHTLRAPFGGIVSARHVEQGEWVSPGVTVVDLVSLDALLIDFQAPQWVYQRLDDLVRLEVRFGAMPDARFDADIAAVVPVTDRSSRTFRIRARLEDPAAKLIPGLSASATMHLRNADSGVVVDRNALIRYPDGRVTVWVVDQVGEETTTVTEKRVSTGLSFDGRVSITDGLQQGELVVVNGNESLREGQSVSVRQRTE